MKKRGVLPFYLTIIIILLIFTAIMMIVIFLLKGKLFSLGDKVKDLFRGFRR